MHSQPPTPPCTRVKPIFVCRSTGSPSVSWSVCLSKFVSPSVNPISICRSVRVRLFICLSKFASPSHRLVAVYDTMCSSFFCLFESFESVSITQVVTSGLASRRHRSAFEWWE